MLDFLWISYVISLALSFAVLLWHFKRVSAQLRSRRLSVLNNNLAKVDLYWMSSQDEFAPRAEGSLEKDRLHAERSIFVLGAVALAGPLGFVLVLITVLSLNFLARSRRQQAVFNSDLALREDLEHERVLSLVKELESV